MKRVRMTLKEDCEAERTSLRGYVGLQAGAVVTVVDRAADQDGRNVPDPEAVAITAGGSEVYIPTKNLTRL
jgi:hypothetical protein